MDDQKIFKKCSFSTWSSFLEIFIEISRVKAVSIYFIITFKQLHDLHEEIFKVVKKCTVNHFSFHRLNWRAPIVSKAVRQNLSTDNLVVQSIADSWQKR